MDQVPYYLERKNHLDNLRRTKDPSSITKRLLEVLSEDMSQSVAESYRQDFQEPVMETEDTIEERFKKYIEEIENERFGKSGEESR